MVCAKCGRETSANHVRGTDGKYFCNMECYEARSAAPAPRPVALKTTAAVAAPPAPPPPKAPEKAPSPVKKAAPAKSKSKR